MNKKTNELNNITIIGTGAWGTSIAKVLSKSGNTITMYGVNEKEIIDINNHGMNKSYFGHAKLNTIVKATNDLKIALDEVDYIVLAIPSISLPDILVSMKNKINNKVIFINLIKGIDPKTKKPWSETINKFMGDLSLGVVSLIGPSFAIDVFQEKPTIVNAVSKNDDLIENVINLFKVSYFKLVPCNDEIGAEIIAAYKNLLAIGMGIVEEVYKSINTTSSFLVQGISEIEKIVLENGGRSNTILEYCGVGDIFLTCTSDQSRNFSFGKKISKKISNIDSIEKKVTIEGYTLYKSVGDILLKRDDLPLFKSICLVLSGKLDNKMIFSNYLKLIKK